MPLHNILTIMTRKTRKGQGTAESLRNKILLLLGVSLFSLFGACAASQKEPAIIIMPENFVFISGGEFTMGSPEGEVGREEVSLANGGGA